MILMPRAPSVAAMKMIWPSRLLSHASAMRLHRCIELQVQRRPLTSSMQMSTSSTEIEEALLDPYDILRTLQPKNTPDVNTEKTMIPLPTQLSPSSLDLFQKCPQAFFFQYILKLKPDPPTSPALVRGTCCHTALEEIFELKPSDRSLDNLMNLFRRAWGKKRGDRDSVIGEDDQKQNDCACLFRSSDNQSYDIDAEKEWGEQSLDLLKNYYELEDPKSIPPHNPITREMWVHARFDAEGIPFIIRGIIDRIDIFVDEQSGKVHLQIIDYKTGKKPHFKYSQHVNERIEKEHFFNMRLYALILWKMIIETERGVERSIGSDDIGENDKSGGDYKYRLPWQMQQKLLRALGKDGESNFQWSAMLDFLPLRLLFLTSHPDDESANDILFENELGKASYLDAALKPNLHQILDETEQSVISIYKDIKELVDMQDPMTFKHCDRKFCNCHEMRMRFRYGSVWSSA